MYTHYRLGLYKMKMPKRLKIMWLCITSHLHNPHIYVRIFPPLVINYVDGYLCNANTVQGFGFIKNFKMWNYGSLYPLYGKRVASFLIQLSIQVKPVCTRWKLVCQVKTRVPHGLLVARYFATQQICPRHTGFFFFIWCHVTCAQPSCENEEREPRESHTARIQILCCQNKLR